MAALGRYIQYGEEEHLAFAGDQMTHAALQNVAAVLWLQEHCAEEIERSSDHAKSVPAAGGVAAAVASEQGKACSAGSSLTTARRGAGEEDETPGAGAAETAQHDDAWRHGEDRGGGHRDDRRIADVKGICCEKVPVPTSANRQDTPRTTIRDTEHLYHWMPTPPQSPSMRTLKAPTRWP